MSIAGRRGVWWAGGAVAALAASALTVALNGGGTVPVAATTATVQRGTVSMVVSAAGTVESSQTRGLSFATAGTVTELDVRPGDLVTAGQTLARIDPTDAQAAVDSAAARVNDAQQAADKAVAAAALPPCPTAAPTPTPDPAPTSGRTPAGPTPTGGSTPTGTGRSTVAPSAVPSQTHAQAGTCTTPGRGSTSDQLLAAQQQLNNAKLALIQANARLAGTVITAPSAGRVLSVAGTVGQRVLAGGTGFIVLGDVSTLTVVAQFTEADVGRLAVGQPATITLPDRGDPLTGTVSQIDPAGTVTSRLVRYGVAVAFDVAPADLLLGQSATVMVTTASAADVLYLPSSAVAGSSAGTGQVTIRVAGHDEARTVQIGLRGDQYTEITDGLAEGDVVVLGTGGA
jgi:multidrug efflux pump subunit AcrA (membrane-fusion protein)